VSSRKDNRLRIYREFSQLLAGMLAAATTFCVTATAQTNPPGPTSSFALSPVYRDAESSHSSSQDAEPTRSANQPSQGLIRRSVERGLEDQKQLYLAPFKVSNLKWDALFLATTGGLIAADRHIERNLPGGNLNA
jgi:hypothetical protein